MGDTYVKVGGSWQTITTPYVKVGGTWQECTAVYVKTGGAWQEVWAAGGGGSVTVSPRADGDTNVVIDYAPVTCYVGCHFDSDGNEYEVVGDGGAQTNSTVWLDSGSASSVWVEFVRTAGNVTNWDTHTSGTRYNLGSNQRYQMSKSQFITGSSNKSITGYFRMWDAASGGNTLWTGSTVEWRCTATYLSGDMCSIC